MIHLTQTGRLLAPKHCSLPMGRCDLISKYCLTRLPSFPNQGKFGVANFAFRLNQFQAECEILAGRLMQRIQGLFSSDSGFQKAGQISTKFCLYRHPLKNGLLFGPNTLVTKRFRLKLSQSGPDQGSKKVLRCVVSNIYLPIHPSIHGSIDLNYLYVIYLFIQLFIYFFYIYLNIHMPIHIPLSPTTPSPPCKCPMCLSGAMLQSLSSRLSISGSDVGRLRHGRLWLRPRGAGALV